MRAGSKEHYLKILVQIILAMTILIVFTACNPFGGRIVKHGDIVEFEVKCDAGSVRVNFNTLELCYYRVGEYAQRTTIQLNEADLAEYNTFVNEFINRIFTENDQVENNRASQTSDSGVEHAIWTVIVLYDDGEEFIQRGVNSYPEDWETLVEMTNSLIGNDFLK